MGGRTVEEALRKIKNKSPYLNYYNETRAIVEKINKFAVNKDISILDVGCGLGRNIAALKKAGYHKIVGVEKNPETIALNRKNGYICETADSLNRDEIFDLIIFSHIIEHFVPADMIQFMDSYLDMLKEGGYALIATPIISHYFYSDHDHIKPCYPLPLIRIFGPGKSEVQQYSRNKLVYKDIWVHRSPIDLFPYNWLLCIQLNPAQRTLQAVSTAMFYLTRGVVGRKHGWLGIFQKVGG